MALALPPSEQLKEIRNRLGITTRDVAEFSHRIAQAEDNSEFHISNAWLTQIENSDSVPSIFKLYSLSSIYRIKFSDILLLYGVDLQHLTKHQLSAPLPKTHLTQLEVYDTDKTVSFPVRFDRSFDVDNTNLRRKRHQSFQPYSIGSDRRPPRKRGTQYSRDASDSRRSRSVLDPRFRGDDKRCDLPSGNLTIRTSPFCAAARRS